MRKRFFCLICAVVVLLSCVFGTRGNASAWIPARPAEKRLVLTRPSSSRRPSPLVSAMFLILAGMGVTLLFDKKGK